jgi:S1-C subfamily serine protease
VRIDGASFDVATLSRSLESGKSIQADSPVARAGRAAGDLIVDFDGHPVVGGGGFYTRLTEARVAVHAPLVVVRRGESRVLPVVPAESLSPRR